MDKNKIIAQLFALLKDASAEQCDLVLTFVEHMTNRARDDKASGKTFTLTTPDAIEIAYIIQRSQGNPQLMHKLLLYCKAFEKAYSDDDQK